MLNLGKQPLMHAAESCALSSTANGTDTCKITLLSKHISTKSQIPRFEHCLREYYISPHSFGFCSKPELVHKIGYGCCTLTGIYRWILRAGI